MGRRQFMQRTLALSASLGGMATMLQACGGGASSSDGSIIKWASWGDVNIARRFQVVTDHYNATHQTKAQFISVPSYDGFTAKMLAQFNANVAPDVFYAGDVDLVQFIKDDVVVDLAPLLNSLKSQEKPGDFIPGLWGIAKSSNGKIYGVPNDADPILLWYNEKVLQDAGVTVMPADLAEQGKWTRDAFTAMLEKVHASGKYGYILDNATSNYWSWVTCNGGTIYADNGRGQFIAHENPGALDAFKWLSDSIKSKLIIYAGSLSKGQGDDLVFLTNQAAFIAAGRWFLPEFRTTKGLQYDVVPLPSKTGKIAPAAVDISYSVLNKRSKNQDAAFDFLSYYVSKDGQKLRLEGGDGISTPSVYGIDDIVVADHNPPHAQYLIDTRNIGYAMFPAETGTPGLTIDIQTALETIFLQGKDVQTTLATIASNANPRIQQSQQYIH